MDDKTQNLPGSWQRPTSSLTKYEADDKRLEFLTMAAKRLFSQFKTDGAVDPKTYLVAVIAVLGHYTDDVVVAVTHPFSGMASKQNWLPTIHELRQACDAASEPVRTVSDSVSETLARRNESVNRGSADERKAHVERLRREGKLTFAGERGSEPRSWFDRMTPAAAKEIQARYEREAQQQHTQEEDLV